MSARNLNLQLNLSAVTDQVIRDNFQKILDFLNLVGNAGKNFQAVNISVTANAANAKISQDLGSVPADAIITRLIAPSAAKLTLNYSSFDKEFIYYTVTGLAANETLTATVLIGTITDLISLLDKALVMTSGGLA